MAPRIGALIVLLACAVSTPRPATAQDAPRAWAAELVAGYAGFVDDATIDHAVIGGSARVQLSPRMALGPELVYMRGPGADRDLFLTGNVTFDVIPRTAAPPRVSPFLVAGAGLFRNTNRIGPHALSNVEGAFTAGGGVRVSVGQRAYAAVDARIGWELHTRITGGVGIALR